MKGLTAYKASARIPHMKEALTSEKIIAVSKKWQDKISSGTAVSMRELFDLATDVVDIRADVGLASPLGRGHVAVLPYQGVNLRLIAVEENPNERSLAIILAKEGDNPQELTEAYLFEKKPDSLALLRDLPFKQTLVSMRHTASFKSLLVGGARVIIPGKLSYEDQPLNYTDRQSFSEVAKAIWASHLQHQAPLQEEYLSSAPAASV